MNKTQRTLNSVTLETLTAKQPEGSTALYECSWAAQLQTDTISESTWSVVSGSATLTPQSTTANVTACLIAPSVGSHIIANTITSGAGIVDTRYFNIVVPNAETVAIKGDYQG